MSHRFSKNICISMGQERFLSSPSFLRHLKTCSMLRDGIQQDTITQILICFVFLNIFSTFYSTTVLHWLPLSSHKSSFQMNPEPNFQILGDGLHPCPSSFQMFPVSSRFQFLNVGDGSRPSLVLPGLMAAIITWLAARLGSSQSTCSSS